MTDTPLTELVCRFPAELTAIETRATDDELLTIAKRVAPDPSAFEQFPPYFWAARISTSRLDAHFTNMRPSTLKNFADESKEGRAFQDAHKTDSIMRTLGYSLGARYTGGNGDGVSSTTADYFTALNLDVTIDSFVNRMRLGLLRDVSVGFFGGEYICAICGREMLRDWDCIHLPGFNYTVEGDKKSERVLATAGVENAHLSEVSGVYDGSTPGAAILKAQREAENGRIKPEAARMIETRYRIHLPEKRLVVPGIQLLNNTATSNGGRDATTEGADMSGEQETPELEQARTRYNAAIEQFRSTLRSAGFTQEEPAELFQAVMTRFTEQDAELTQLRDVETSLRPMAAIGERHRKERIDRAITEGKRAFGAEFDETAERTLLESFDLDGVNRYGDANERIASKLFPGGRVTVDHDERETETKTTQRQENPAAYAGG